MKIINMHIRYLEIGDECPKCGKFSNTDLGMYNNISSLPDICNFYCMDCDIKWEQSITHYWEEITKWKV